MGLLPNNNNDSVNTHTEGDEYLYPPNMRQDSRSDHDKDDQEQHQQGETVRQGLVQHEHLNPTFPNQDSLANLKMLAEVAVKRGPKRLVGSAGAAGVLQHES